MSAFKKEIFNGWIDTYCLVTPGRGEKGSSQNGVMYTGEFIVILNRLGELTPALKDYWKQRIEKCELHPGHIIRYPGSTEVEGPDNYHGYLAAAKLCDPSRAKAFLWYGLTHFGLYPTSEKITIKDFMWRFPQLIPMALMAAGLPVGPFRAIFILTLMLHVWSNTPTDNQDARRLGWLLIQTWDGKGLLSKWAVKKWQDKLMKEYPVDGMKEVYHRYYEVGHPFIEYVPVF